MAGVTFYGILWLEGANDVVARFLNISLYLTTEIARYAIFIGPVVAYWVTKRICLGLQRKDNHLLEHGVETGIIRQLPNGEYIEVTRPVSEEMRAVLEARAELPQIEAAAGERRRGPGAAARGPVGKLRVSLNRVLTENIPLARARQRSRERPRRRADGGDRRRRAPGRRPARDGAALRAGPATDGEDTGHVDNRGPRPSASPPCPAGRHPSGRAGTARPRQRPDLGACHRCPRCRCRRRAGARRAVTRPRASARRTRGSTRTRTRSTTARRKACRSGTATTRPRRRSRRWRRPAR